MLQPRQLREKDMLLASTEKANNIDIQEYKVPISVRKVDMVVDTPRLCLDLPHVA